VAQGSRAPAGITKRIEIAGPPTCASCRIEIERVTTLGDEDGPGAFTERPYAIRRDSRGRYYTIGQTGDDRVPAVYDAQGRFLRRLGRLGRGPGEYLGADQMLIRHDSLYVFDNGNARLTVLSPSYQPVRTAPIPRLTMAADFGAGDTLILNAQVNDRERVGLPFHRFDVVGNYHASFGDPTKRVSPRTPDTGYRLAAASGGGFWAAPATNQYRIERWTMSGHKLMEVQRRVPWYEPYEKLWTTTPTKPPAPQLYALWEDKEGLLWVICLVADLSWARHLGPPRLVEGEMAYGAMYVDGSKIHDTMVEVFDMRTGVVLASQRLDVALDLAIGDGLFSSVHLRDDGWPEVVVWRLRLARNSPHPRKGQ